MEVRLSTSLENLDAASREGWPPAAVVPRSHRCCSMLGRRLLCSGALARAAEESYAAARALQARCGERAERLDEAGGVEVLAAELGVGAVTLKELGPFLARRRVVGARRSSECSEPWAPTSDRFPGGSGVGPSVRGPPMLDALLGAIPQHTQQVAQTGAATRRAATEL